MTILHDLSAEYAQLLKKAEKPSQAARRSTPEESMSPGGVSSRNYRLVTFVIEMHIDQSSWTTGVPTMKYHTVPPAAILLFICQGKEFNYWV